MDINKNTEGATTNPTTTVDNGENFYQTLSAKVPDAQPSRPIDESIEPDETEISNEKRLVLTLINMALAVGYLAYGSRLNGHHSIVAGASDGEHGWAVFCWILVVVALAHTVYLISSPKIKNSTFLGVGLTATLGAFLVLQLMIH